MVSLRRPEQLEEVDRRAVWHAFTQMAHYEPLIIESAYGCTLVDIHGVDLQACGGTHVASTAEIGAVEVRKIEKKGRHNRRVNVRLADPG